MMGDSSMSELSVPRVVRFDRQCVLIPQIHHKHRRPVVATRSYSLPLWKRRSAARSPSPDSSESRVVIRVPIPTFTTRSRSPIRGRSVSMSPPHRPCLVHRDTSMSPTIPAPPPPPPLIPPRDPSFRPFPAYQRRQNDITVPLRECCQDCERITEESIREGDLWQEKFSRGARRRRALSLDEQDAVVHIHPPFKTSISPQVLSEDEDALGVRCGITLTVDEVDKRRNSLEFDHPHQHHHHHHQHHHPRLGRNTPSPTSLAFPSNFNSHERDISSSSASSHSDELSTSDIPGLLDSRHHHHQHRLLRASPIEEEDEAELFPLPRRTPSATPSPKSSASPSPNGSSSHLPSPALMIGMNQLSSRSGDLHSSSHVVENHGGLSSQESLLKASLTRKKPEEDNTGLGISVQGSPLSGSPMTSDTTSYSRPLPPLPPPPSSDDITTSIMIPNSSSIATASATPTISPSLPRSRSHPSSSSSSSPPTSASSPPKRKLSFTVPFAKVGESIKGVGVDVLKGVNSMNHVGYGGF